jgi:hypothetical protein
MTASKKPPIMIVGAVALLFAGYYFGMWGYFGLFMGEPNYAAHIE